MPHCYKLYFVVSCHIFTSHGPLFCYPAIMDRKMNGEDISANDIVQVGNFE